MGGGALIPSVPLGRRWGWPWTPLRDARPKVKVKDELFLRNAQDLLKSECGLFLRNAQDLSHKKIPSSVRGGIRFLKT
ncbi:hypothetical protein B9T62_23790 [Paenibacillus donghaensis]|uniref:Uncharacterized protein n=1 Tax=Paenibacillus donghaensis TaxID=414771 RepID=A0A2Z2KJS8_9BACL|nr:hypothetical protein B9T62_23790 [Paenibacillus donghaensis]